MTLLEDTAPGGPCAVPRRRAIAWAIAAAWPPVAWLLCGASWGGDVTPIGRASLHEAVLVPLLLAVAMTDVARRKIPNWATYPALLWALAFNAMAAAGAIRAGRAEALGCVGLGDSLAGMLACGSPLLLIYRAAGGGAGDVKLAAAIGAWLGAPRGLNALILSWIVGGAFVVSGMVWTIGPVALFGGLARALLSTALPGWVAPPDRDQRRFLYRRVPLAAFFAVGTGMVLFGVEVPW